MRCAAVVIILLLMMTVCSSTAGVERTFRAAVMEFGTYQNIDIDNLKTSGSERTLYDYVVNSLADSKMFELQEREQFDARLKAENLNYTGEIDADSAARIGELLNVDYIICGNVESIAPIEGGVSVLENGVQTYAVHASVSLILLDIKNDSIRMSHGEGDSKTANISIGSGALGTFNIGSKQVAQISVSNALEKASSAAINNLIKKLSAPKKK